MESTTIFMKKMKFYFCFIFILTEWILFLIHFLGKRMVKENQFSFIKYELASPNGDKILYLLAKFKSKDTNLRTFQNSRN